MDNYLKYLKYKKKYNILLDTLTILQRLIKIHNISKIIQPILFNDNFNISSCIRDANINSLLLKDINKNDCKIYLKFIKTSYDNLNKFNKLKFKKHRIKNYLIIISVINFCLMNYKPSYIVNPISILPSDPINFITINIDNIDNIDNNDICFTLNIL